MKLKLTYVPYRCFTTTVPHYDLHTIENNGDYYNIACIVTDKKGAKLIRKWIARENEK
jgi:hypothetical protein